MAVTWKPALAVLAVVATACTAPASKPARSAPAPAVSFPQLEGVYRQGNNSYVVTYQGWWLDMGSQVIRQLQPAGGGAYTYGPGWMVPTPAQGTLLFHIPKTGTADAVSGTAPGGVHVAAARVATVSRDVSFPSDGATIAGTITVPPGAGRHPGVVIVQGSGALDRHFESISNGIYVSLGFAVLSFDKRGVGMSSGTYPGERATAAAIAIQSSDAAAAARFLMAQPDVDPRRVGFDGNSQGGWVAPLATEQVPGLRFEILVGAPAVTSEQQMLYAGFSGGSAYVPTESDADIDAQVRAVPGCAGNLECYDPAPALRMLDTPTLWIYGQLDRQVPVRVSADILASLGNGAVTVDVLPGGNHGTVETVHGLDSEARQTTRFAGSYFADVRAWLADRVFVGGSG